MNIFWEGAHLVRKYRRIAALRDDLRFSRELRDVAEYEETFRHYTGRSIRGARILDLGCGNRPIRLLMMQAMGWDVVGLDVQVPLLSLSALPEVVRRNGPLRAFKSLARYFLSARRELAALRARHPWSAVPLVTADIADPLSWDAVGSIDLVVSEDVFEHLSDVETAVEMMASALSVTGLALIRPNIFTGITGGHVLEWDYPLDRTGSLEPWDHLRRGRGRPNTYLNRLSRADFRAAFARWFDIVEERVLFPELGREYMTPELREEVSHWSDEELFSNRVLFVLRRKTATTSPDGSASGGEPAVPARRSPTDCVPG
ncbi:MAG: methyltransferase domain-containing protein [Alphaproteobacteria bacterium]|nr:methyltransferase domain-containing protein [Alphaproteobacteria bacterium]